VHALKQEERERTKLFNERFKVAAELLAGDQVGLRIAGVSAMASLADDWEAQRQMCVDTLIDTFKLAKDDPEVANKIFRALRSRLSLRWGAVSWSSLDFDFSGLEFHGADFSELRFGGTVIFDGAEFSGEQTSFERTTFDALRCHGTTFTDTVVNFRNAVFDGSLTEFVGCEFVRTKIDLRGSELRSRRLHFSRCEFTHSELNAQEMHLDTAAVRIEHSALAHSTLDLTDILGTDDDSRGSLGFLFVDGCKLEECEVLLRPLDPEYQFVWWRDNTLVGGTFEADPKPATWLKVRGEEPERLPTTSDEPQ
jgi:uncharacterized protein YjbI with pentapeptide repeats